VTTVTNRLPPLVAALSLAASAALLLGAHDAASLHFLQKAAGFTPGGSSVSFTGAKDYLSNLQSGIAPLAIPAATIGLSVGGIGLLTGAQWARTTLTGVVIGASIVFLGPTILQ
jgi:hypothetical protein